MANNLWWGGEDGGPSGMDEREMQAFLQGQGASVPVIQARTEYINGKPQKMVQKFRAYASYEESFADYAKLMKDNPRYERVLASGASAQGFASGLQRAGYATDPAYADKLARVINTTLRLQKAVA